MLKKCSIINKKYTLGNLSKTLIEHKQQTVHVETVVLLGNQKTKPDSHIKLSVDMDEFNKVKNGEK